MIEWKQNGWYSQAAKYRQAVITQDLRDWNTQLQSRLAQVNNQVKEYQTLLASEMKIYIQQMFADKISTEIRKNIWKAMRKADISGPDKVIRFSFPASSLRFNTPEQIEKQIMIWYINQLPKRLSFSILTMMPEKEYITTYRVVIPEIIYSFTK